MHQGNTIYEEVLVRWRRGRARVLAVLWVCYGSLYLCRSNLPAAKSALERAAGLSKSRQGYLDFAFKGGYAAGQWLGGVLGDRYGGRVLLGVGTIGGAAMCLAFGLSRRFAAFALWWALNGFWQSFCWPGVAKCFANWFPPRLRGSFQPWLASAYQIGPAVGLVMAGVLLDHFPWRLAFLAPAAILFAMGVIALTFVQESPQAAGLPSLETLEGLDTTTRSGLGLPSSTSVHDEPEDRHLGYRGILRRTIANPRVWCVATAFLAIDIARHGTFDWIPRYLSDLYPTMNMTNVALRAWTVPLGGTLGAVLAGWATDRFFGSRRVPLIIALLFVVSALMSVWARVGHLLAAHAHVYLLVMGFFIYAPQVLIVGPLTMDLATRKATASASGIVGTVGYGGAALMSVAAGEILQWADHAGHPLSGWRLLFNLWSAAALAGMLCLIPLWRFRPGGGEYH